MRYTEVCGVFCGTGEGAFVEELPLRGREGDVGVESADAVEAGFVVVVAGEVGDFGEGAGRAEGGIICEDCCVVYCWVEGGLREGLGGESWDVASGG